MKQPRSKLSGLKHFSISKYLYSITIVLIVAGLCFLFLFLYRNVYLTLSQAEIVTMLKKEIPEESLNKSKLTEIIDNIKIKTTPKQKTEQIKNPFLFIETTASSTGR